MRSLTLILPLIVVLAGCNRNAEEAEGVEQRKGVSSTGFTSTLGMEPATLPGGYSISHPQGWTVRADPGRTELQSLAGDQFVLIAAVLGKPGDSARSLLDTLLRQGRLSLLEQPRVIATRGTPDALEALLQGQRSLKAHALVAMRGGAATLYLAGAAESIFKERLPDLIEILKSFSYHAAEPQAAPANASLRYTRVEDRQERARIPPRASRSTGISSCRCSANGPTSTESRDSPRSTSTPTRAAAGPIAYKVISA